jgi:hypothetical protein
VKSASRIVVRVLLGYWGDVGACSLKGALTSGDVLSRQMPGRLVDALRHLPNNSGRKV